MVTKAARLQFKLCGGSNIKAEIQMFHVRIKESTPDYDAMVFGLAITYVKLRFGSNEITTEDWERSLAA